MNKILLLLALLASAFANAQQPVKDTASHNYTLIKRNTKDSIRIDVSKIYQGTTQIGKIASSEAYAGGLVNKTMTVELPDGTKVAEAFTDTKEDTTPWHVITFKDNHHEKVITHKGREQQDILWYLVKGSYL